MTGRYSTRTGVWHTINGRSMMHPDELTLAEVFKANGYATAMIGKWHLGDNYPCRPEDQGFDHTVWHQGGGVDNAPDYWGNDYFDDTYKVNGAWQKFEGYCTDVWFREAIKYVEQHRTQPLLSLPDSQRAARAVLCPGPVCRTLRSGRHAQNAGEVLRHDCQH